MKKYEVVRMFFRNLEVQNKGDVIELSDVEAEKYKSTGYVKDYKRRSRKANA